MTSLQITESTVRNQSSNYSASKSIIFKVKVQNIISLIPKRTVATSLGLCVKGSSQKKEDLRRKFIPNRNTPMHEHQIQSAKKNLR